MNQTESLDIKQNEAAQPLVSIIIPAYNKAALTVRTVESVLNQTYPNTEVIVVDDGSTDDMKEQMSQFENRIQYFYKENGGACSARNLGINHAKGKYLSIVDGDDLYVPEKIEQCVRFLEERPDYGLVHTDAYYINDHDQVIGLESHPVKEQSGWIKDKLVVSNFICNPTIFFRKECLDKTGRYDESMFPTADWDLWLRISEHYKIGHIKKPLSKYRVIANSCFKGMERTREEHKIVLDRFFDRNPDVSVRVKNKSYAHYHLCMAQNYFLQENITRMKEEFWASLKHNPFNLKTYALLVYYVLARKSLRTRLTKKILVVTN